MSEEMLGDHGFNCLVDMDRTKIVITRAMDESERKQLQCQGVQHDMYGVPMIPKKQEKTQ